MDITTREEHRRVIAQRRRPPVAPQRIYFAADGIGECVEIKSNRPLELCIEATDREGTIVPWLTDEWWIRTTAICEDRAVTVVILPTPQAALDTVVLHQLEMVRRICPRWHLIGYVPCREIQSPTNPERWLNTPYDEIRLCDLPPTDEVGSLHEVRALLREAAQHTPARGYHHASIRLTGLSPFHQPSCVASS